MRMASAVLELVSGNYRDVEKENQRSHPFPQTVMGELVCAGWKGGSWKNICLQVAARILRWLERRVQVRGGAKRQGWTLVGIL